MGISGDLGGYGNRVCIGFIIERLTVLIWVYSFHCFCVGDVERYLHVFTSSDEASVLVW